jgi:hypothetical protein
MPGMAGHSGGEPVTPEFDEPDLAALFARTSASDVTAAVLTEAHMVLADLASPLDAELWGSDVVAALGSDDLAGALVSAAENAATPEALLVLRVLAAVGPPGLGDAAAAAAARLAERGTSEPDWANGLGAPAPGECWRYGDEIGQAEAVTMSFGYGSRSHVLSALVDHSRGGGIRNVWVGETDEALGWTKDASREDPTVIFEMISQADARSRLEKALAAQECPLQPDEAANVSARRALLQARVALLPAEDSGAGDRPAKDPGAAGPRAADGGAVAASGGPGSAEPPENPGAADPPPKDVGAAGPRAADRGSADPPAKDSGTAGPAAVPAPADPPPKDAVGVADPPADASPPQ